MQHLPERPSIEPDGSYHKLSLKAFLLNCEDVPQYKIAQNLGVSLDRIIYVMSAEGWQTIFGESR